MPSASTSTSAQPSTQSCTASARHDAARHDVLIVGGGLVGASLAIALDRIGVDVGLVEATPAGTLPAVFDQRNLSFAEATVNALTTLGVLQKLQVPGAPIRRIHVSRKGDFGRVLLEAADYGREAFGQVVVARDFGQALEARLDELSHLTRYRPARFIGLHGGGDDAVDGAAFDGEATDGMLRSIKVADDNGERVLSARLLVAADGARSGVREALGIDAMQHDYEQTLFVSRVAAQHAPDGTAYERFGDTGPTAFLPRADRHYGVIHGVARASAEAVAALDAPAYLACLQQAFGWRVGRLLSVGTRSTYPGMGVRATRLTASRAVLVGNAAQSLHPVGAQGFNLGLRDALTLAEMIENAGQSGTGDPGTETLLGDYVQRRQRDRDKTLSFSDTLARLTANTTPALRPLRSLGLLALDRLPSAQAWLVGGAMGYRGDVPRLCRAVQGTRT